MYKLLIVEDEKIEREGLLDFINWESLEISIVGTASNGYEGIKMAKEFEPDIILTDIQMPRINGLDMLKEISGFLSEVKSIILTVYEDFSYAKEAIELKVFGYVLKPIIKEELSSIIKRAVKDCKSHDYRLEDKSDSFSAFQNRTEVVATEELINELMLDDVNNESIITELRRRDFGNNVKYFGIIVLSIGDHLPENLLKDRYAEVLNNQLFECISNMVSDKGYVYKQKKAFGYFDIFLKEKDQKDEMLYWDNMRETCLQIRKKVMQEFNIDTIFGITIAEDISDLKQAYEQARQAHIESFFDSSDKIMDYNKVVLLSKKYNDNKKEIMNNVDRIVKELSREVRVGSYKKTEKKLDEMFDFFDKNQYIPREQVNYIIYTIIIAMSNILHDMHDDLEGYNGSETDLINMFSMYKTFYYLKQELKENILSITEHINYKIANKAGNVVKKAIDIIHTNFMDAISLQQIADQLYISPKYMGMLFKEGTGQKFNEYLTDFRMNKAKEFLQQKKYKTYEVAEMVGVPNLSYFCTLFKNKYGCSPGEFRGISIIRFESR